MTNTSSPAVLDHFETQTCGRCGGSGRYSIGQCFGCGGSGTKYTRRGLAALRFFEELSSLPIVHLREGDRYWDAGCPGLCGPGWVTVERVTPRSQDDDTGGSIYRLFEDSEKIARAMGFKFSTMREYGIDRTSGEPTVLVQSGYNVVGKNKRGERQTMSGFPATKTVRVADPESKAARMDTALKYQSMLGKSGKLLAQYR